MPRVALLVLVVLPLMLTRCSSSDPDAREDVLVKVRYVAVDPQAGAPVLLLEEQEGKRRLPIWIGFAEARSIAAQIEHREQPRPNTHDLAKRVIDGLKAGVERVVVTELRDGTYFAMLVLHTQNGRVEIDSRPSDAIAIALRFEAPVYVRPSVFEDSGQVPAPEAERHVEAPRAHGVGS
jgi:bifunctional DNase/RNase